MTNRTQELIARFAHEKDISLLPSIIIGMQEDDNIANITQFKNSLRFFRNLAAHEPEVITTQIVLPRNRNTTKLCFIPNKDIMENRVVIDLTQLTAWLFEVSLILDNQYYLVFWRTFVSIVCPCLSAKPAMFKMGIPNESLINWYMRYKAYCNEYFRLPIAISTEDPYLINLYKDNQKIFWRMAIPDMMTVVAIYLFNVDLVNEDNLRFYLKLFKVREGV